jgi:hypothetical protein
MKKIMFLMIVIIQFGLSQNQKEGFGIFYDKFFRDSTFQISRIVFPLKWHCESPTYDSKDSLIEKANWVYSNYSVYKNEFNIQIYDNFQKNFRNTNERLVSFEGVECGINLNLYFKLIHNKWYLVKIIDNSD